MMPSTTVRDVISPLEFIAWQIFGYTVFAIAGVTVIAILAQLLRAAAGLKRRRRRPRTPPFQMTVVLRHGTQSLAFPATVGGDQYSGRFIDSLMSTVERAEKKGGPA